MKVSRGAFLIGVLFCAILKAMLKIEKSIRREYDLALEVVPQLVRQESKPIDFLRTDDFDPEKAAMRLAMYWKFRKYLFQDRWLLPMTQTGTGTLTMNEVEILRSGYSAHFERPGQGSLILHDHSRLEYFDTTIHARLCMYFATVLGNPSSQTIGTTLVFIIRSGKRPTEDFKREAWGMFRSAMPVKTKQILIVQAYEEGKEHLLNFLAYQTKRTLEMRAHQPEYLVANSVGGTLSLLEQRGINRQHVPNFLGGDYNYDQFGEWVRMRLSIEDIMSPAPLKRNKLIPKLSAANISLGSSCTGRETGAHPTLITARKQKTRRKKSKAATATIDDETRKMNAMYARRAYHKRKFEVLGLKEEVESLRVQNKKLKAEYQRLEQLLIMAWDKVPWQMSA